MGVAPVRNKPEISGTMMLCRHGPRKARSSDPAISSKGHEDLQPEDAVLLVETESFLVSRETLARLSPYFRALFFGGGRESGARHVEIKGVAADHFRALMESAGSLKLRLDRDNVLGILETADFLQMEKARMLCCKFLERELHLSNCLGMMSYAWRLGLPELHAAARGVALTHFPALASAGDFLSLSRETVADLLASDALYVPREDLALEAALRWATFDPGREEDFADLAGLVRPEALSLPYITKLLTGMASSDPRARLIRGLNTRLPAAWATGGSAPRTCSREALIVIGGSHEADQQALYKFNPRSRRWQAFPPLQTRRLTQYSVAAVGDDVVVTGGYFRDILWHSVDWVRIYRCGRERWVDGPAMLKARHSHCSAGLDSRVFVLGGSTDQGPAADVERLVMGAGRWDGVSPMVRAVERAAVVTAGACIYVACGLDESGEVYGGIQRYAPEADRWDVVSWSPFPRYDLLATELNGALYVLGGKALRLDVETDEWTLLDEPFLDGKFFTGCATVNGQIYLISQRKGNRVSRNMVLFDPYIDACIELDSPIACPVPVRGCVTVRLTGG